MPITLIKEGNQFSVYAWEDNNSCPLLEFLEKLEKDSNSDAEKILYLIERTADQGAPSNEQQCKQLEDGIYEFKARNGVRVLWFYHKGGIIICSHGFVKKKQKTPREEIKRAKKIRNKYLEESDNA